jgi:hypothetical protein
MKAPSKDVVIECLRNYKRCLGASKWKLSNRAVKGHHVDKFDTESNGDLDSDEFFCVINL